MGLRPAVGEMISNSISTGILPYSTEITVFPYLEGYFKVGNPELFKTPAKTVEVSEVFESFGFGIQRKSFGSLGLEDLATSTVTSLGSGLNSLESEGILAQLGYYIITLKSITAVPLHMSSLNSIPNANEMASLETLNLTLTLLDTITDPATFNQLTKSELDLQSLNSLLRELATSEVANEGIKFHYRNLGTFFGLIEYLIGSTYSLTEASKSTGLEQTTIDEYMLTKILPKARALFSKMGNEVSIIFQPDAQVIDLLDLISQGADINGHEF